MCKSGSWMNKEGNCIRNINFEEDRYELIIN